MMCASVVFAQPAWLDPQQRKTEFPNNAFFTGFASDEILSGESQNDAIARVTKMAQGYVAEAVRVEVNVATEHRATSQKVNESEEFNSIFEKTVKTAAKIDLTGLTTENHINSGNVYAFAYVNKYELKGNYSAIFTITMQQLESAINTAKQLETNNEKAKARKQYEDAIPLLVKAEQAQDVLSALGVTNLQSEKTANYRSEIVLALARLAQGVYIHVESTEDLFGKSVSLVTNKVKGILSKNGCSFTTDAAQADFFLKLNASAREYGNTNGIIFCYADVEVELIKKQTQKTVYKEEVKEKDGHTTAENAARSAFEKVGTKIANELMEWVR